MTVSNTSSKQPPQLMDGAATNFSFTFEALTDVTKLSGIKATILNTLTDVETDLIFNDGGVDGYTVSVDADGDGGSITVIDARSSDFTITIFREYDEVQETNYADFNAFPSETVEDNQDLLTFIAQQSTNNERTRHTTDINAITLRIFLIICFGARLQLWSCSP